MKQKSFIPTTRLSHKELAEQYAKPLAKFLRNKDNNYLVITSRDTERVLAHLPTELLQIRFYPIQRRSGGTFSRYEDYTLSYTCVLDSLNVPYTMGNSAPKGGKEGTYIEVQTWQLKARLEIAANSSVITNANTSH